MSCLLKIRLIKLFSKINLYSIFLQLKNEAILGTPPSSCCDRDSINSHNCPRALVRREIRATINISLIVLVFIVSWFPLHVAKLLAIFCKTCNISLEIIAFTIVIAHSNSAINPLLYAYHLRDIRRAILKSLKINVKGLNY